MGVDVFHLHYITTPNLSTGRKVEYNGDVPKVSKNPLPVKDEVLLFVQLTRLFTNKTAHDTQAIFQELLGPEERLMLAKRFAIIALLWKKQSMYSIAQKLHISTSTVARIHTKYTLGDYDHIITSFEKPSISIIGILEAIDDILHLGGIMPHYGQSHKSEAYKRHLKTQSRRR